MFNFKEALKGLEPKEKVKYYFVMEGSFELEPILKKIRPMIDLEIEYTNGAYLSGYTTKSFNTLKSITKNLGYYPKITVIIED